MASFYYGAKIDPFDPRDFVKTYLSDQIASLQVRSTPCVDLRKYVDHVYNQGSMNSCTANAVCSAYGMNLTKQKDTKYVDPSRLFLYYITREREGTKDKDEGASLRTTLKSLNKAGVCKEIDWPYPSWWWPFGRSYNTKPDDWAYECAKGNTACEYDSLKQDLDQFRSCLKSEQPFIFSFTVYESFERISSNGQMPMPKSSEKQRGRHAVVAVGYDDRRRSIIALNSWGSGWGDKGYFYMPYDYILGSECGNFWMITRSCQRKTSPNPVYL